MPESLNPNITQNSLIADAVGEEITAQDQEIIDAFNTLPIEAFKERYGDDTAASMVQQQNTLLNNLYAPVVASNRSTGELAADTVKNVISGAITGVIDTGALATNLLGAESLSRSLSKASQGVQEISQSLGSEAEKAQQIQYSLEQQGLNARLDREYREDLANGMSEGEAQLARFGKEAWGTLGNLFSTGQATQVISSGLGSLGSAGAVSGGLRLAGKGLASVAKKVAPTASEKAVKAFNGTSDTTKKIINATPWMASVGLQEGGSQFTQVLNEALNTPIEDLYANSPAFVEAVKAHMDEGLDKPEAEKAAREDMAFAAGRQAGLETAAVAAVLNYFTRGLERPLSRMGKSYGKYVGEALVEPGEESLTELTGQYLSNAAIQDYVNKNQQLTEGLGQSFTEGAVGGLGIVGARAIPKNVATGAGIVGNALTSGISSVSEAIQDRDANPERLRTNISNIESNLEDIQKEITPSEDGANNFASVIQSLRPTLEEVNASHIEDGKSVSNLTPERNVELLERLNQYSEVTAQTEESVEKPSAKLTNSIRGTKKVIEGLRTQLFNQAKDIARVRRNSYQNATPLTQDQINQEGLYLSSVYLSKGAKAAQKEFTALASIHQKAIQEASFENLLIDNTLNSFFTNIGIERESIPTPAQAQTEIEGASTINENIASVETPQVNQPLSKDAIAALGEKTKSHSLNPSEESSDVPQIFFNTYQSPTQEEVNTIQIGDKEYQFTPEEQRALINSTTEEEFNDIIFQVAQKNLQNFLNPSASDHIYRFKTPENEEITVSIKGDKYQVANGQEETLPEETQTILNDSSKTSQEKAAAVVQLIRHSESLDPEQMAQRREYFEDGEFKNFDSKEIEDKFRKTFGDQLADKVTPVRRGFHLWNSEESPAQVLINLIQSKDQLLDYLRKNKFTNAESLVNALYNTNNFFASLKSSLDKRDSLVTQVVSLINPNGSFVQHFQDQLNLDDLPIQFSEDAKEKLKDISALAAVQFVAMLSAYRHDLNLQELNKFGIDPDIQEDASFNKIDGVIEPMAQQNLATLLRKFMGVAQNNLIDSGTEMDKFFGTWAVQVSKALYNAGIIEESFQNITYPIEGNKTEVRPIRVFKPQKDFKGLFSPKTSILLSLIDPTMKNVWRTEVPSAKGTFNHSMIKDTPKQKQTIQNENEKPANLNTPFISLILSIGGQDGFNNLLNKRDPYSPEAKKYYNFKDLQTKRGQTLSRNLAFDLLGEILACNPNVNFEDLQIYFSNVVLKNSRIFQEGAATYQSNKLVRQFINYRNAKSVDLSDPKLLRAWKLTLAQKLGEKVNSTDFSNYEKKIDEALQFVENFDGNPLSEEDRASYNKQLKELKGFIAAKAKDSKANPTLDRLILQWFRENTPEGKNGLYENWTYVGYEQYFKQAFEDQKQRLERLLNPPKVDLNKFILSMEDAANLSSSDKKANLEALQQTIQAFNDRFADYGYTLNNEESLNALVEMIRYNQAKKDPEALKTFTPRIFLEIDGINDGPSNINSLFTLAISNFTPLFLQNSAKTGNFIGVNTTSQEALAPNTKATKFIGVNGADYHTEAAKVRITKKVLERLVEFNKQRQDKQTANQGELGKDLLYKTLRLLSYVGFVEGNIYELDKITKVPSDPKDYPFTFSRDFSKKLTTIIPYGSEARGSTQQLVSMFLAGSHGKDGLYGKITELVEKVNDGTITATERQTFESIMNTLNSLLNSDIDDSMLFKVDQHIEGVTDSFTTKLPTKEELNAVTIPQNSNGKLKIKGSTKENPIADIRNFEVLNKGLLQLTKIWTPLIGEPAQAAINEMIGNDGMKGARIPTAIAGILNIVAQGLEQQQRLKLNGNLRNASGEDQYKNRQELEKVSPIFTFTGGAKVVIEKRKFITSQEPLYVDKETGFSYTPSMPMLDSASVSGGPLTVQAVGDASMILEFSQLAKDILNFGQVYDGIYLSVDKVNETGELINKASAHAQTQEVINSLDTRINQVGKWLISKGYSKAATPKAAITDCVIKLAKGQMLDGSPAKDGYRIPRVESTIVSYVEKVLSDSTFDPKLQVKNRFQSHSWEGNIEDTIRSSLNNFFEQFEAIALNEKINHIVVNAIPKTVHHMSADTDRYIEGTPLTIEEGESLLESINQLYPDKPFDNFYDLLSAYMNHLRDIVFETNFKNDPRYKKVIPTWQFLTDKNKANEGTNNLLSNEAITRIEEAFKKNISQKLGKKIKEVPITVHTTQDYRAIKKAFDDLAKTSKHGSIFKTLYSKLSAVLPKDVQVSYFKNINELPNGIKQHFKNKDYNGLFLYVDGYPRIYIRDLGEEKNKETLVHEAIHAVISGSIHQYYEDPSLLNQDQRDALKNLENLLNDFLNTTLWDQENAPKALTQLRKILEDKKTKAEKLDESLAYILSNQAILNSFTNYQLRDVSVHTKNFMSLMKRIITAAKNAWMRLFHIVTGSPLNQSLDINTQIELASRKSWDFLGLYGANTLVFINEEQKAIDKDKNLQKRFRNKGIKRASLNIDPTRGYLSKGLQKSLYDRLMIDEFFKFRSKRGTGSYMPNVKEIKELGKTVQTKLAEEIQKIQNYEDGVFNAVRDYVSNPEEFSKLLTNLMDRNAVSQSARNNLYQAYSAVINKLDETFMLDDPITATQEEIDKSKILYDLITHKDTSIIKRENLALPEIFNPSGSEALILFALAQTCPEIAQRLPKVNIKSPDKKAKGYDPISYFENIGNSLASEWAIKALNNSSPENTLNIAIAGKGNIKTSPITRIEAFYDVFLKGLGELGMRAIIAPFELFNKTKIAKEIETILKRADKNPLELYKDTVEYLRSRANRLSNPILAHTLSDIVGRTPSNTIPQTMLKEIKGFWDRIRKAQLEDLPKLLEDMFKNTKITPQIKKFLFRTVVKTDLSILALNEIQDILKNPKRISYYIQQTEASIQELAPNRVSEYLKKSKQLAQYLNGGYAGHWLLTNSLAIARLLGSENLMMISENDPIVNHIDRLITFYALAGLNKGDLSALKNIYAKDTKGMEALINYIKDIKAKEEARVNELKTKDLNAYTMAKHNNIKGWMPKGNDIQQDIRFVPQEKVKEFTRLGYKNYGKYPASNIDSSEPVYILVAPYSLVNSYQEGIIQHINKTAFGYQINKMTRGEILGSVINNQKDLQRIYRDFDKETSLNGVIPIFTADGSFGGFERSVTPELRKELESRADIFSGITQYLTRQERERLRDNINAVAIQAAWEDYENADEDTRKTEFIDVLHTNVPIIQDAVNRLDSAIKKEIKAYFPNNHFYLRKDLCYTYLGYRKTSLTDMWDGKFILPKEAELYIAKCLDLIFGKENAQNYVRVFEQLLSGAMTFARDTIVVRSGIVPFINALTNIVILHLTVGMPFSQIYKFYKQNWAYTQVYKKTLREIEELEFKKTNSIDEAYKAKLTEQIKNKNALIKTLPIYRLLKEGEYSTISDTGVSYEGVDLLKQNIEANINGLIDYFGKGKTLKKATSEVLMLKGSKSFQTMAELVNMGDWLAKVTAYRYLTEEDPTGTKKLNMGHDEARNIASTLFIDYDQFVGRERDWLNRTGITWFMTFKYRITVAALFGMLVNPTRMIWGTMLNGVVDFGGTPLSENFFTKLFSGELGASVGLDMLFRGLLMHPITLLAR